MNTLVADNRQHSLRIISALSPSSSEPGKESILPDAFGTEYLYERIPFARHPLF